MKSRDVIFKGAMLTFFSILISKFLQYVYRLYIAKVYGPEGYGIFALSLAILGIFQVFAILGMPNVVSRYISYFIGKGKKREIHSFIISSYQVSIFFSFIFSGILFVSSDYLAIKFKIDHIYLKILSFGMFFIGIKAVNNGIFLGYQKIKYYVLTEHLLGNLNKVFLAILFGIIDLTVLSLVISWTVAVFVTFLISISFLLKKKFFRLDFSQSFTYRFEILKFSLPMTLSSFLDAVMGYTDSIMLGLFFSPVIVGIYNIAMPTAMLVLIFGSVFYLNYMPKLSELYGAGNFSEIIYLNKLVSKWVFFLAFPLAILLVSFPKEIIFILFGENYIEAYVALRILSLGFLMRTFFEISNAILHATRKPHIILFNSLVATFGNVLLNYILIPIMGIMGAAIASFMSTLTWGILILFFSRKYININPLSLDLVKIITNGLISISLIKFLSKMLPMNHYLIVSYLLLYAASYLLLSFISGVIKKEHMDLLKDLIFKKDSLTP